MDILQYQRFCTRQEKLRRTLTYLRAIRGLKQWRTSFLKQQSYRAIEARLLRLKQREKRAEVLREWQRRTEERQLEGGADHHKEWLVRYYGRLCEGRTGSGL